jgi:hypothetical protein
MAAQQAAGNMFKEYGGDFFQTGGNNVNYQNRVQDILMKGQAGPSFASNKMQMPASTQQRTPATQQAGQQYTPEQLAAFQTYMQQMQSQRGYAPNWQTQQHQGNAANLQAMSKDPAYLKYLQSLGIQDVAWNAKQKMGLFGPKFKSKGHVTFRTYYDPKTGKTVTAPNDQAEASGQPDSDQQMQQGNKGPGFIKNLIAKNKQRKADKKSKADQTPLTQQEKEMRPDLNPQKQKTPAELEAEQAQLDYEKSADALWDENVKGSDVYDKVLQQEADAFWNQNLQNAAQAKRNYGKTFPDPSGFKSYAPTNNAPMVNPRNNPAQFPTFQPAGLQKVPYTPGAAAPGFAYGGFPQYGYGGAPQYNYGGFPQYNYGGYSQYEEGAELEMDDEAIANYLAMGGTLEYLD